MRASSIHDNFFRCCSVLVYQIGDFYRVDSQHRRLSSLEIDSHVLLSSLLLEMGSCVRQRFLDDSCLNIDEAFLQDWTSDETEVLRSSDEHLRN